MNEAAATLGRIQEATFTRASFTTARAFPSERRMDAELLASFLTSARTGVFATVRPDGRPHATPTGFALVGPRLVVPTLAQAARVANLRHEPHASLVVTAEPGPRAVVIAEGTCRIVEPLESSLEMRAPFRAADGSLPDWIQLLIILTPERLLSWASEGFQVAPNG